MLGVTTYAADALDQPASGAYTRLSGATTAWSRLYTDLVKPGSSPNSALSKIRVDPVARYGESSLHEHFPSSRAHETMTRVDRSPIARRENKLMRDSDPRRYCPPAAHRTGTTIPPPIIAEENRGPTDRSRLEHLKKEGKILLLARKISSCAKTFCGTRSPRSRAHLSHCGSGRGREEKRGMRR